MLASSFRTRHMLSRSFCSNATRHEQDNWHAICKVRAAKLKLWSQAAEASVCSRLLKNLLKVVLICHVHYNASGCEALLRDHSHSWDSIKSLLRRLSSDQHAVYH